MSVSHTFSNRLMISYGSAALAAQGVSGKITMVITMVAMGICMGMQSAISYNYSAGNHKRMLSVIRSTGFFTVCVGTLLSILCFLLRDRIILAFIDNAEVIASGQIMVLAGILSGSFYGIYQLCQTYLQSTGKASYATFVALLDKGLFFGFLAGCRNLLQSQVVSQIRFGFLRYPRPGALQLHRLCVTVHLNDIFYCKFPSFLCFLCTQCGYFFSSYELFAS